MTVQIASTEFRKTYAQLEGPHEVTALGRVIGIWLPATSSVKPSASPRGREPLAQAPASEAAAMDRGSPRSPAAPTGGTTPDKAAISAAYKRLAAKKA
jgi:hypothetical protein